MNNYDIGIFTIQSKIPNYGNRLQNYAIQYVFQLMGREAVSVLYNDYNFSLKQKLFILFDYCSFGYAHKALAEKSNIIKESHFKKFNEENIKKVFIEKKQKLDVSFNICSAGSDQVWNPKWYDDFLKKFFLLELSENTRKISFSASFGIDQIPENWSAYFSTRLNDFKAISVREEAGAKIIKELTGRDATVLVDPTMLLSKEEWRKVSKKPKGAKTGYILTYFLSPKCDEANNKLDEIKGNWTVYELLNLNDSVAGTAGPSEFLWLFEHADFILTDSFHACVFSFLFNKPFLVYDRNWEGGNMNSRLETLLSKFHLERKYANSGLQNDIWEHDYEEGYRQLEIERKKAMDFLKEALGEPDAENDKRI